MWNYFDVAVFAAGYAACWFTKDKFIVPAVAAVKGWYAAVKAKI